MHHEQNSIQKLVPLFRIIKDRESAYFDALSFTNKNIDSSSNDFDQICIFSKFLAAVAEKETKLTAIQNELLGELGPDEELCIQSLKMSNNSKEMMRLYTRSLELIEESVQKARKTLFADNGRLALEFTHFKKGLHKIVQCNSLDLQDFATAFIKFSRKKFRRQIEKLRGYLNRLQQGDHVIFRDIFVPKDGSDASSPDERALFKSAGRAKKTIKEQSSEIQSPHRRLSGRRNQMVSKPKRNSNMSKLSKREDRIDKAPKESKKTKAGAAAQLLKFYQIMQLNKKQFLEDHIFEKQAEQQQQKRLMAILIERNKLNDEQIKQYYGKCKNFNPKIHSLSNPSSDDNQTASAHRNESEAGSRISLKRSFIISKRKPSFTFESSGSDRSDVELPKNQIFLSSTIKNISASKRPGTLTSRARNTNNSNKKIFVVKSPIVFEDDVIPKVETTTNHWLKASLGRDRSHSRKNDHIRLKRRNNPCPLDTNLFPESFQFTQYPL